MKKLSLIIIAITFSFIYTASAQKDGYTMFYNHYNDMDEVVTFKIPGAFAQMFMDDEDEGDEAQVIIEKMDKVSFLIADNANKDMLLDLNKALPGKRYNTMMEIRDGDAKVIFFAREDGTVISEIVMTVVDGNSLVVMCIYGNFTKQDAKRIAKSINTESAVKIRS